MTPFVDWCFSGCLRKAGEICGFRKLQTHSFKRGSMNSLWEASEKGLTKTSPRMLKEVGDHALNYHERYVRPSKVFVAKRLKDAKHKLL